MSVRPARPADLMRLVALMQEGHAQSVYRDKGSVDAAYARKVLARSIQQHGGTHFGAAFLVVAHDGEDITGFYWAFLNRAYEVGDKLCATEVHNFLAPRASRRDGVEMLRRFMEWANSVPDLIEVLVGKTDIIKADDGSYERYLQRKGFVRFGSIYRLEVNKAGSVAA